MPEDRYVPNIHTVNQANQLMLIWVRRLDGQHGCPLRHLLLLCLALLTCLPLAPAVCLWEHCGPSLGRSFDAAAASCCGPLQSRTDPVFTCLCCLGWTWMWACVR